MTHPWVLIGGWEGPLHSPVLRRGARPGTHKQGLLLAGRGRDSQGITRLGGGWGKEKEMLREVLQGALTFAAA